MVTLGSARKQGTSQHLAGSLLLLTLLAWPYHCGKVNVSGFHNYKLITNEFELGFGWQLHMRVIVEVPSHFMSS